MVNIKENSNEFIIEMEQLIETRKSAPEQVLFLTVILQAILDATKPEEQRESSEARIARDNAKAWFAASVGVTAEDFGTVCDLAGIDINYAKSSQIYRSKIYVGNRFINCSFYKFGSCIM